MTSLWDYGCIWCRAVPSNSVFLLCQPCHDNAMLMAPMIIRMHEDHGSYKSVAIQFQQSWMQNTPCPQVRAVYKIISTEQSLRQYQQYLDTVEARGNFQALGWQPGNEKLLWHGTRRKCYIGSPGVTTFCNDPGCSLCCILQRSYDLNFCVKGRMFGTGIYTSSASSKSNDYSKNVGIYSELKAMLLNKVVVGYYKNLIGRNEALIAPPPGYDSVVSYGHPNHMHDRLVVYNNNAVRPSYLVMYQAF
ncbi:hypothetical protein BJ322DRAFT_999788 [Thelephora terrestris]|uniref:PARP catalytic domain-containing protein n=1 Tax=Thelephora terrestris TaxID=56493 RepID=A0A9P6LAW2_9AGAM|nr:hypothetical protein BJ322DRAFT_999788 [Thelephora terrestris]